MALVTVNFIMERNNMEVKVLKEAGYEEALMGMAL